MFSPTAPGERERFWVSTPTSPAVWRTGLCGGCVEGVRPLECGLRHPKPVLTLLHPPRPPFFFYTKLCLLSRPYLQEWNKVVLFQVIAARLRQEVHEFGSVVVTGLQSSGRRWGWKRQDRWLQGYFLMFALQQFPRLLLPAPNL